MNPSEIAVTNLLLGQSAFYASGHSNSFASFDLTNGFNGIETSRAIAVALQALLSNYFGPVWWSLSSLRLLLAWSENQKQSTSGTNIGTSKSSNQCPESVSRSKNHINGREKDSNVQAITTHNGHAKYVSNGQRVEKVERDVNGLETSQQYKAVESKQSTHNRKAFAEYLALQSFYTATTSLAVLIACIWKRNDPSIWTVLTPKCLNIILWAVFQHLMVNFILCTAVWMFVTL